MYDSSQVHTTSQTQPVAVALEHEAISQPLSIATEVETTENIRSSPSTSSSSKSDSDKSNAQQRILEALRKSLLPFSDRLDPFAALPVVLDRFQEHLVTFYLIYYPRVSYGFSPQLQPHPVATNFSIALTTPACFQVALARSALYRLSLSKYAGENEKQDLELAVMRHKGEALKHVRQLNARPASKGRKDDLIASIISLGTLDRRTGDSRTANMHYKAVRRMLRATGGPLAVQSLLLSRVMVFFECIYGTSPESYVWDSTDLTGLIHEFNGFLDSVYRIWKHVSSKPYLQPHDAGIHWYSQSATEQPSSSCRGQTFYLSRHSPIHTILARSPTSDVEPTALQRLEQITQVTCLITLASLLTDRIANAQFASLTMNMLDLDHAVTKLCPRIVVSVAPSTANRKPGRPRKTTQIPEPAHSAEWDSPKATTDTKSIHSIKDPETTPTAPQYSSAPTHRRPSLSTSPASSRIASHTTAPAACQTSTSAVSSTTLSHATLTIAEHRASPTVSPGIPSPPPHAPHPPHTSTSAENALPQQPQHDTTAINASNIMWLLHITDHSDEHTRRVWNCASFAWVAKHLSYATQKRLKEWLLRFLEGRNAFVENDDDADNAQGRPRRGNGGAADTSANVGDADEDGLDGRPSSNRKGKQKEETPLTASEGGNAKSSEKLKNKKMKKKVKEQPFVLEAFDFSYAN